MTLKPNRLIHSASPYLLQHAYNPVDWYEWGEEAWTRARSEDKPVLVSIGYSACHWCHVMEHESFENDDTAALMNEFFINIKVDREERPDVDQLYMDAVQLMNGRGGWPLNAFCLPDGRPIYGGTYFPNRQWNQLLFQISSLYRDKRSEAEAYAQKVLNGLQALDSPLIQTEPKEISPEDFLTIQENFMAGFDWDWGGNMRVPKFPMPVNFELLRMMSGKKDFEKSVEMLHITLEKMASGGIYDHIGGGFARYSTDREWLVPHFEKMLYDNGQLIHLYASAGRQHNFLQTARHSAVFCLRELRHEHGAFFSAYDADSEGEEGKYYTWHWDELEKLLGDDLDEFASLTGCTPQGNWEHGQNIIHLPDGFASVSSHEKWPKWRQTLYEARGKRIKPGLDDKIITAWNAVMISGLCKLSQISGDAAYLLAAKSAADFNLNEMMPDGNLLRSWCNGINGPAAFLEDFALLMAALIDLTSNGAEQKYFETAKRLMQTTLAEFYDEERGSFYFTPKNGEQLIARKTDLTDDVIPSANAIMSRNLMRLGLLSGEAKWLEIHDHMQAQMRPTALKNPAWYSYWLQNDYLRMQGAWQIVVSGPNAPENAAKIRRELPDYLVVDANTQTFLPLALGKSSYQADKIYVCEWQMCHPAFENTELVLQFIQNSMTQRG